MHAHIISMCVVINLLYTLSTKFVMVCIYYWCFRTNKNRTNILPSKFLILEMFCTGIFLSFYPLQIISDWKRFWSDRETCKRFRAHHPRLCLKQRLFMPDEANFLAAQDANIITLFYFLNCATYWRNLCIRSLSLL